MCKLLQIQDGGGELMNQCRGKRKLASRQANQRSHSVVVGHLYCSSVSCMLTIAVGNKRLSVYIMRRIKKHSNPHNTTQTRYVQKSTRLPHTQVHSKQPTHWIIREEQFIISMKIIILLKKPSTYRTQEKCRRTVTYQ